MSEKPQVITVEEAQAAIKRATDARLEACGAEIEAVLKRYGCTLAAIPFVQQGLIVAQIQVQIAPVGPLADRAG